MLVLVTYHDMVIVQSEREFSILVEKDIIRRCENDYLVCELL